VRPLAFVPRAVYPRFTATGITSKGRDATSIATTIYESDDYLVTFDARAAARVIVTFSFFEEGNAPAKPFAARAVGKLGFAGIFVVAKEPHWCQTPDRAGVIEAVREAAAAYPVRVAYGGSKGGYSALSLGAAMGCQRIVAISPQTVISDPGVPLRQDWAEAIAKRPILHDTVAADLGDIVPEIVFDPTNTRDHQHVSHLRSRHRIREGRFPFASHKVLMTFKQCNILQLATHTWLTEAADTHSIRRAFRKTRHRSPQYFLMLGIANWKRGRMDILEACRERVAALGDPRGEDMLAGMLAQPRQRKR
jgi:hypothetical protein